MPVALGPGEPEEACCCCYWKEREALVGPWGAGAGAKTGGPLGNFGPMGEEGVQEEGEHCNLIRERMQLITLALAALCT